MAVERSSGAHLGSEEFGVLGTGHEPFPSDRSTDSLSVPTVQFINSYPPPTAIWRCSRLWCLAAGKSARLATVCIGNFNFSGVDRSISSLEGAWPFPPFVNTSLNFLIPEVAMKSLTAQAKRTLAAGGLVHYLSEDIRPWLRGRATVVSVHGNPMATLESSKYYSFHEGYKMAVRYNLQRYARTASCVVHSEYVRNGLREFGYDGPVEVIPHAVDPIFTPKRDKFALRKTLDLPIDKKIILSVSTAELRKNLQILPKVMDLLPSDFLLVRIGPPVRGSLTRHDVTDSQLVDYYAASDLLLFPTLEEGFGFPVVEAFASGLPVVSSDIPVVREVASDAAQLADPTDPPALALACRSAASDPETWRARGLERATNFSIEILEKRLSRFYCKLSRASG